MIHLSEIHDALQPGAVDSYKLGGALCYVTLQIDGAACAFDHSVGTLDQASYELENFRPMISDARDHWVKHR